MEALDRFPINEITDYDENGKVPSPQGGGEYHRSYGEPFHLIGKRSEERAPPTS